MNYLDSLTSLASITDKINKSMYPFATAEWAKKLTSQNNYSDLVTSINNNNYFGKIDWLELAKIANANNDFTKLFSGQLIDHLAKTLIRKSIAN